MLFVRRKDYGSLVGSELMLLQGRRSQCITAYPQDSRHRPTLVTDYAPPCTIFMHNFHLLFLRTNIPITALYNPS